MGVSAPGSPGGPVSYLAQRAAAGCAGEGGLRARIPANPHPGLVAASGKEGGRHAEQNGERKEPPQPMRAGPEAGALGTLGAGAGARGHLAHGRWNSFPLQVCPKRSLKPSV